MTSKPKIPQEVIAFLKFITTDYFPELEPIRYLLSFRNGVYNVVQAKFYPYGQGSMEYRVVDSNGSATYKRWVSCNYIDNEFFDVNLDPTEFDQIELKRKIVNADGEEEQEKIADWRQVAAKCPKIYGIFQKQGISFKLFCAILALMGRALYWGKELENWQVALFFIGAAGNGKSTILMLLRFLYILANVAILSNNIERQWAISAWIGKFVLLGFDIKGDCQWEQAEFQSCTTMEEVLVSKKHETPSAWLFNMHIFIACNEFINAWRDNSKSVERRCLAVKLPHFVQKEEINPELLKEIMDPVDGEYTYFIQAINLGYRWMTSEYAKKDVRAILSDPLVVGEGNETYFEKNAEELIRTSNPMLSFITSGEIVLGSQEAVAEVDFRRAFDRFCYRNGFSSRQNPLRWSSTVYTAAFQKHGIKVREAGTRRTPDGPEEESRWFEGISLKEFVRAEAKTQKPKKKISSGNKSD
jgi:hypothetical protein